jgi:TP901 family phage tail tape measure protein
MAEEIIIPVRADTSRMSRDIEGAASRARVTVRAELDSRQLEAFSRPLGRITGQADEFSKSMEAANARVLAFGASVGVMNAVAEAFKQVAVQGANVEKALLDIKATMGDTSSNFDKFGRSLFDIARNSASSFEEASKAALEFSRQGLGLEETLKRTNAALIASRLSGLSYKDSVDGLTAAVNAFSDAGLTQEQILNKLIALDTRFAVGSKDLIEGISRSASVAQEAGVSFDELASLITVLQEKTARGGAVIGNAFKAIFPRLQSSEVLASLRDIGVVVDDANGKLLPFVQILRNVSEEYDTFSQELKKQIGGGFQIDRVSALMKDLKKDLDSSTESSSILTRALKVIGSATDEAFQKNTALNRSTAASYNTLTLSAKELAATISRVGFGDNFKKGLDSITSIFDKITNNIAGVEDTGTTLGQAIVKGIGSVLSGPGFNLLMFVGVKLLASFGDFIRKSLPNLLDLQTTKRKEANLEKDILSILQSRQDIEIALLSQGNNKVGQAQVLLNLYREQIAAIETQRNLAKELSQVLVAKGVTSTKEGTKIADSRSSADGYMPESAAIQMENMNKPSGSKIIIDRNFPMGGGKRGTMVYNSSEKLIPNFANTGGTAIIPAFKGYVPNFADDEPTKPTLSLPADFLSVAGVLIGGGKSEGKGTI